MKSYVFQLELEPKKHQAFKIPANSQVLGVSNTKNLYCDVPVLLLLTPSEPEVWKEELLEVLMPSIFEEEDLSNYSFVGITSNGASVFVKGSIPAEAIDTTGQK